MTARDTGAHRRTAQRRQARPFRQLAALFSGPLLLIALATWGASRSLFLTTLLTLLATLSFAACYLIGLHLSHRPGKRARPRVPD